MRAWIVGTGTRNAFAISPLPMPPTTRSVNAIRASLDNIGWQAMNIKASTSSSIASGLNRASAPGISCARSRASKAYFSSRAASLLKVSIARRRPVVSSHPTGSAGTPLTDQDTSASASASCARSSASGKSPV